MDKLSNVIKILSYCEQCKKEIESIKMDCFVGNVPYDDTYIAIYFKNGNSIGIFNSVYEVNEEEEQIGFEKIEDVLDFITDIVRNNLVINNGDMVEFGITMTNDEDMNKWIEEQKEKQFEVIGVDFESRLFYIKGCPYAINLNENYKKVRE